jgi:signal transduction histidine kinase
MGVPSASMRLGPFIQENLAAIVSEWEAFAYSLYPESARMTPLQLQDHAREILAAVVKDLASMQTREAQSEKSKGRVPGLIPAPETAAETHAVLRAQTGMNIRQLVSEYRALRATVLRLWQEAGPPGAEVVEDMIRFNEAIDQAVAESVAFFDHYVERARNLMLGTLGHDMRNPLNAISMTAATLVRLKTGEQIAEAAVSVRRSTASIKGLVDDLVDFSRTAQGVRLHIEVGDADLAALFEEELKEHRAARPDCRMELAVDGDTKGRWDGKRLRQVLRNLLANACEYGTPGEPVLVRLDGTGLAVVLEVKNRGAAIDASVGAQFFNPLTRGPVENRVANPEGLGLGLFIVREIARAHGGDVDLRSEDGETVFTVHLPRAGTG